MKKACLICLSSFTLTMSLLIIGFLLSIQPLAFGGTINADGTITETANEYAENAAKAAEQQAIKEGKTPEDAKKAGDVARQQAIKDFNSNKPLKDPVNGKNVTKVSDSKPTGNSTPTNNTPNSNSTKPPANNTQNTPNSTKPPASNNTQNKPNSTKPPASSANNTSNSNSTKPSTGNTQNTPNSNPTKPPSGNTGNNSSGNSGNHSGNNNNSGNHGGNNNGSHPSGDNQSEDDYYQSKGYTIVYYNDNAGKTVSTPLTIGMAFGLSGASSSSNYTSAAPTQTKQTFPISSNSQFQTVKTAPSAPSSNKTVTASNIASIDASLITRTPAVLPSVSGNSNPNYSQNSSATSSSTPKASPMLPQTSMLQSLKNKASSLLGGKNENSKKQLDEAPVPKLALKVTDSKPVIISNNDGTPFKIYIDGQTPLIRMKNSKPVKLDGVKKENVMKGEDGSFIFRGGKKSPITLTSQGNNIITLVKADGTSIRIRVQGLEELGESALFHLDDPQETADGEGITITVWGINNPLAWKKSRHISGSLIGAMLGALVTCLGWLFYIGFFSGRVPEKYPLLKFVSNRIYNSFEFFRRSSYKAYTKTFSPPPRRIL